MHEATSVWWECLSAFFFQLLRFFFVLSFKVTQVKNIIVPNKNIGDPYKHQIHLILRFECVHLLKELRKKKSIVILGMIIHKKRNVLERKGEEKKKTKNILSHKSSFLKTKSSDTTLHFVFYYYYFITLSLSDEVFPLKYLVAQKKKEERRENNRNI